MMVLYNGLKMLLNLKKIENALIPCDEDTVTAFNKLSIGDEIYAEFKPRRNYKFHKKLFSMLNLILNNQEHYKSVDNILTECKFKAGYFETQVNHQGEQRLVPKSIDFSTMDNEEFSEFYSSCIDTCLELVPMGAEELEQAILRFA